MTAAAAMSSARAPKVEARYRGRSRYFPGRIARENRDGTYDIDYDDGEKEQGVEKSMIKPLENSGRDDGRRSPRGGSGADELREGMKVEARFRGRRRYFPGRITRVHRDGTYDIDYDDGEKERGVEKALIRSLESGGGATITAEAAMSSARA